MTSYVALLRGVNLGMRQLRMEDLRRIAGDLGLGSPRTYIASGNLLFSSDRAETDLKRELEGALEAHMGSAVPVMLRTASEMIAAAERNPFAEAPGNRVVAIFLDAKPPADTAERAKNLGDERIALGKREIYVHYPGGQGPSKLQIPDAAKGTARNMNSVAKLAELAREVE